MTVDTAGGIAALISAVKQHAYNAIVQKNACCGVLANFASGSTTSLVQVDGFVYVPKRVALLATLGESFTVALTTKLRRIVRS
jgi:hypothetical protein